LKTSVSGFILIYALEFSLVAWSEP